MNRRTLLHGSATIAAAGLLPSASAAAAPPVTVPALTGELHRVGELYRAAHYEQVAARLPALMDQACTAAVDTATNGGARALAEGHLALGYNVATQLLIKLGHNTSAMITARCGTQAASRSGDVCIIAETQRVASIPVRRTRDNITAEKMCLTAADTLHSSTGLQHSDHRSLYGRLLATAAYTAAFRGDGPTAWEIMNEAHAAAQTVGLSTDQYMFYPRAPFSVVEADVYRVGIARKLGDFGAAMNYANAVDVARIDTAERVARFHEDAALAFHGAGRYEQAFGALRAAHQVAPQEVRLRPWAHTLTADLITRPGGHHVREFARVAAIPMR